MKLYLETTVFNYYYDEDRDGHEDVRKLFKEIQDGKHEAYTSEYAEIELKRTEEEPKRSNMLNLIERFDVKRVSAINEAQRLAALYIENGAIPTKYRFDALHIAISSICRLDCVVSYNFKHINRLRAKIICEKVNRAEGYGIAMIGTAKEVLNDEE